MPGAATSLTFDIFARDNASATFRRLGEQASGASDNVKHLSERLDKIGQRAVTARIGIEGDKEANSELDKITARLTVLDRKVANPDVTLEGAAKMRAEISSLELALDRLGSKTARPSVDLSKVGLFQPSVLGTVAALLPTLIPLAAEASAAVGAIGVSFAAAATAAAGFGAVAATVLSGAAQDAQKLHTLQSQQALQMANLQTRLGQATTKAQRASLEQQIANLKASQARQTAILTQGWSASYRQLVTLTGSIQKRWEQVSRSIATPALVAWLQTAQRGLQLLRPALQPVAGLVQGLGESLNAALANNAGRVKDLAAAFGRFSATQLADVARFITDIAEGVFSLGKDLAASGANFSAAGTWLAGIGDGFAAWSRSAAARRDVHGFMKFIHDEGPVVKGILADLGTILPGIFAGATTVGTLELQALGDFLNLVAKLPKGWQKPLTEFAGAMLLLSKIGVVKVGLKFVGLGGALPGLAGAGAAGGPLAAAGAAIAAGLVLRIREDLKAGIKAIGADLPKWFSGIGGVVQLSASGWADAIVNHFHKPVLAAQKAFGRYLAASARATWDAITASARAFAGAMVASFRAFRSSVASVWDTIWRNTVTRAQHGISDLVGWFQTVPGRVLRALFGLGHSLYAFAHSALTDFLSGFRAVGGAVLRWLGGFVSSVISTVKKLLGIGSPSSVFHEIGVNMMLGLERGIKASAHKAANAARGAARGTVSSSALGGDALANQRLARRIFPWPAAQWPPFVNLVMAESGFNRFARNPSSGAYGIPQALPESKLPFAGQAAGGSHAGPQLSWMFQYISGRYGTPSSAWAHELAYHWYDKGGWLPPGLSLALNQTGRPEQVIPAGAAGGRVTLVLKSGGSRLDDVLVDIIRQAVSEHGGGDVQVALGGSY